MLFRANHRNKKLKQKSDIKYTSIFMSKEIAYFMHSIILLLLIRDGGFLCELEQLIFTKELH